MNLRWWLPLGDICFCSESKDISAMHLKLHVCVIIIILKKSKSHIPRILGEHLKISIFSAKKTCKIRLFCYPDVIKTSM